MLQNGGFSVNRTGNAFAEVSVDMALEQTINVSTKNRLQGIMNFANVSTAVNRWIVTASMKTQLINSVLDKVDMKNINSENKETRNSCIERDNNDLKKLQNAITSKINPFKKDIYKSKLFNIRTGFMATEETEKYLLSILNEGKVKRSAFINECTEYETRFSKSIKKTKIVNFAISNFQKKNKSQRYQKLQAFEAQEIFLIGFCI